MYKQLFSSPLLPKTPDIRCGHNAFAHHVFPRLIHGGGARILEEIEAGATEAQKVLLEAFEETNALYPLREGLPVLALRDISVRLDEIESHPLIVLSLTPPLDCIGTYFVGLLHVVGDAPGAESRLRYLTLEYSTEMSTALCEWVAAGAGLQHRYLREGPKPIPELFVQAIAMQLEFETL